MSTQQAVQTAPRTTLATLRTLTAEDQTLTEGIRREMRSAINTVAKVLRLDPHMVPTTASELRVLLNGALPRAAGVSDVRWRNALSLLRKAIALLDPAAIPARSKSVLLPEWAELLKHSDARPVRIGLARFSKYCSATGITPQAVTQEVYNGFYDDLVAHGLMRSPRETQQAAGHAWNKARQTVPAWPDVALTMRNFRRNPSLPWTAFPESLKADVNAYLTPRSADLFDLTNDAPPMRASTIAGKLIQLRQFATALVKSGRDAGSIRSLADLVQVDAARAGLEVLMQRSDQRKTTRNQTMAYLLLSVARHWVKADGATLKALAIFCRNLAPRKVGMTLKNKMRLQQFDDPALLGGLLNLPGRMMAEASRERTPSVADARIAQLAIANEILLMAPLRIKNISELEVGRTLFLGAGKVGYILIDHTEIKNELDIEAPLPASTVQMIELYLKRFHPLLAPAGCKMLFPSRDGGHKRTTVLAHQISVCARRRCGIAINPHLFRHLAAKIYLDAFPGSYGVIRMLLGHKSIDTTTRTYCGMEFVAAFHLYDAYLNKVRSAGSPTEVRPTKGRS